MCATTFITFLGTCANVPTAGHDSSSFLINGKYLVDTGWYAAIRMLSYGFDPLQLEYLFITHWHGDHFIGLPLVLQYFRACAGKRQDAHERTLSIIGPREHLEKMVTLSLRFLYRDCLPDRLPVCLELVPFEAGANYESDDFHIATCPSVHTIETLTYRFTDKHTGATFAFTGDTAPDPKIVEHVKGVKLLIHDATHGPDSPPVPRRTGGLHSSATEAAEIARAAGVERLALIHGSQARQQASVDAARKMFPNSFWPRDGETVEIG